MRDAFTDIRLAGRGAPGLCRLLLTVGVATGVPVPAAAQDPTPIPADLGALDLDELARVRVAARSLRGATAARASAAVTIVTSEELRRSGATTLPDALRTVPGLQVARVGAHDWAVSIRGFTEHLSNKVAVLVDGRAAQTPLAGGVLWDALAIPLDEVDRIEIIRGPGPAGAGRGAVNGSINIVTRSAAESHGGRLGLATGSRMPGRGAVRYGATFGEGAAYRLFAAGYDRMPARLGDGTDAGDDWRFGQAGFRIDGAPAADRWTVQGDLYTGVGEADLLLPVAAPPFAIRQADQLDVRGGNILGRWSRDVPDSGEISVGLLYEYGYRRQEQLFGTIRSNLLELDLRHRLPGPARSALAWGVAYRHIGDELSGAAPITLSPARRATHFAAMHLQGEVPLAGNRVALAAGSKLEHNSHTGLELQPNVRLLWTPGTRHSLWAAVTRAVRTPTRFETDGLALVAPGDTAEQRLVAGPAQSEAVIAYEAGYRTDPGRGLSLDLAFFYNEYDGLQTISPGTADVSGPRVILPLSRTYHGHGHTFGAELSAVVQPLPGWRFRLAYAHLQKRLQSDSEAPAGTMLDPASGRDPKHQASLHSSMDLPGDLELDITARYVGALGGTDVVDYATARIRLGWRWRRRFELSVVGEDLFAPQHREFPATAYAADERHIERRAYVQTVWRF